VALYYFKNNKGCLIVKRITDLLLIPISIGIFLWAIEPFVQNRIVFMRFPKFIHKYIGWDADILDLGIPFIEIRYKTHDNISMYSLYIPNT